MRHEKTQRSTGRWWKVVGLSLVTLVVPAVYTVSKPAVFWNLEHSQDSLSPKAVNKAYLQTLEESNLASKWQQKFGSEPQLAGTNIGMVNWIKDRFTEFGLDSWVDEYTSWLSYPEEASVTLLKEGEVDYVPSMKEDPVDEWSRNFTVPAFLGYAPDGNVTAQYVFCNYGTKEDFERLAKLGVPLEGKIAIARYGGMFRSLKVKFAQEHGMIGAILYSDPADDGNIIEENGYKPYPEGPARQPSAIQRGSSSFLTEFAGDPTTPGYAIKPGENKTRGDPHAATPVIPVLPLSPREITPILQKLSGKGLSRTEANFSTGLIKGFDYSVGPNPDYEVNLYSKQDFKIGTLHNIMAKIEGESQNEVIIIGNHHDSWTYDAGDPHSGTTCILEIARALGNLLKLGWKPQRTILFGCWDGEEYSLLGSTEFGEYYRDTLKEKVVAYLNLDMSVSGPDLRVGSSPLLFDIIKDSTKGLKYNSTTSLSEHLKSQGEIGNLGSGSDFTVFLDHLGIPSVDLSFSANENSPIYLYHSIYDNYNWMEKYGDPEFKLHNLMSKYLGLLLLNLSETKVIPFTTTPYSLRLQEFFDVIASQIPHEWLSKPAFAICKTKMSVYDLVGDVKFNLGKLSGRSMRFDAEAVRLQETYDKWDTLSYWQRIKVTWEIRRANLWLKYYERHFLNQEGLKNRPWWKHIAFASGRYTGYAGQQFPAMTEALEDGDYESFVKNLKFLDDVIGKL